MFFVPILVTPEARPQAAGMPRQDFWFFGRPFLAVQSTISQLQIEKNRPGVRACVRVAFEVLVS